MKVTTTPKVTLHRFFQPVSAAEHAAALEALAEAAPEEGVASTVALDDVLVLKTLAPDAAAVDDSPDAPAGNVEASVQRRRRRRRQTVAEAAVPDEQLDLPGDLPADVAAPVPFDLEGRYLASSGTFAAVVMVSEFFASFGTALGLGRRRIEFGMHSIDPLC